MRIPSGTTDKYIYFVAVDSTDFTTRETGLSSFTVYRSRDGGVAAAMTTPTINETDSTNMPGVYELLLDEDTTVATGNDTEEMSLHITHAGMAPVTRTVELYRPKITVGNTLDVTSTGAAGIDWGNVENSSTTLDLSATSINLCDTVTTLTGHTAQTGDSYAVVNSGTHGNAALKTLIDTVDSVVDAIKVVTDNLPNSGSLNDLATLAARLTALRAGYLDNLNGHTPQTGDSYLVVTNVGYGNSALRSLSLAIDGVVNDIQTVTDNIPNTGSMDDLATLAARLTALRAGYLDNLNGHTPQTGDTFAALPANFSSLLINGSGAVDSMVQGYLNTGITETTVARIATNFSTFFDNADADTSKTVDDVGSGSGGGDGMEDVVPNPGTAGTRGEAYRRVLDNVDSPISGVGGNIGPGSVSVTLNVDDGTNPLDGVAVWITTTTDPATAVAGTLYTDAFGNVSFMLDPGVYYQWRQLAGHDFTNPIAITVTA